MTAIDKIVEELIKHGEDLAEMQFWISIYDALTPEEQERIRLNLERELEDLKKSPEH